MQKALTIEITGDPKTGKDIGLYEKRVTQRVLNYTVAPKLETYTFARMSYRFIWTADEFDMAKNDILIGQIRRLNYEFLTKWQESVIIRYRESEVE